jgi:tetratricopeptide (TPR) repeat protein
MVLLPGIFFFLFTGVEAGVMGDVREGGDAYRQALREKVGEVAEIRYKKALEAKKGGPDGDKVLMRLGLYRFFKGDYAGSEYYLRRLIERFEGSDLVGEAELWLGRTFLSRGDTRSALVEFRKGLQGLERSGSEDSELLGKYYFWLGETYSRDGNLAEARRCLETVQGMSIVHLRPSLVRDRLRSVYGALESREQGERRRTRTRPGPTGTSRGEKGITSRRDHFPPSGTPPGWWKTWRRLG